MKYTEFNVESGFIHPLQKWSHELKVKSKSNMKDLFCD